MRARPAVLLTLTACTLLALDCRRATVTTRGRTSPNLAEQDPALPGMALVSAALTARLQAALAAKGSAYRPRTHHLKRDGSPRFTNRLIFETSPYLLQHAHNPVSWYAWGPEAFDRARRENKPIFLSVGYSTCHWCHVMEGESFEDEEIARHLNQDYIAIKVDREERPDIDAVYMSAVQALTGSGGWPMSVWLTPDRTPFFGGTYFPPRDGARGVARGFLTLLSDLADLHRRDPGNVKRDAEKLAATVRRDLEGAAPSPISSSAISSSAISSWAGGTTPSASAIPIVVDYFKRAFDPTNGGLLRAPKFPSNLPIRLLLRYHRRSGDADALRMATMTLEKMAAGGIYDQVGGGFHRYATDAAWLVPHFEKMLYDNALLAVAYAEAYQVTGRVDFARITREILDYILKEMTASSGAFYSATDADSDGEEGKFFVWSEAEVRATLGTGPQTESFLRYYGVTPAGNFEGHNILHVPAPNPAQHAALAGARARLYAVRARRVPPARDEKILASWNGLMVSALAVGGRVLDEARYVNAAATAADFLVTKMRPGGHLARSFKDGRTGPPGFLEDNTFVAAGLFDLYEASLDPRWLREALDLCTDTQSRFADPARGGWYASSPEHERLLARERPTYDGAIPSGTSVALLNALRAATFTGDDHWRAVADRAFGSLHAVLSERPLGLTDALLALDFRTDTAREIAIVWSGRSDAATAAPLLAVLRRTFLPNKVIAAAAEGENVAALSAVAPFVAAKRALGGRSTAYVCQRGRCQLPTNDPAVLARQLTPAPGY